MFFTEEFQPTYAGERTEFFKITFCNPYRNNGYREWSSLFPRTLKQKVI